MTGGEVTESQKHRLMLFDAEDPAREPPEGRMDRANDGPDGRVRRLAKEKRPKEPKRFG